MSSISQKEEEVLPGSHTYTGPKGVINDWRRFKLDSMDQNVPPGKRDLIRQMSTPRQEERSKDRKMSAQEYELIKEEDERCLKKYRKQCMLDLHQRLSFGPKFQSVFDLDSGEAFLEVIEQEHRLTLVVVHIYQDGVKGCEELNSCLDCLAAEYPTVKFCRIDAVASGAAERFSSQVLPALLVYRSGELLNNFLSVTQHFHQEFFAADVEAFLNEHGLLPEKELNAGSDEEEGEVE